MTDISPEQLAIEDFNRLFNQFPISGLNGQRLFLTGCTGFIGFWLLMAIHCLNRTGANITVTALSRNPDAFISKYPFFKQCQWLSFCQGDVTNYVAPQGDFDLFIHGATDTSPSAISSSLSLFQSMVQGTNNVFSHAVSSNARRVLLISSGAVYGEQPQGVERITEDASYYGNSFDVKNVYGEGKRAMEMMGACYAQSHNLEVVTARCFAFLGYGLPKHLAINQFIHDALYADAITVKGNGKPIRSYLYAADLAIWLLTILLRGEAGNSYNVGSDEAMTIASFAYYVNDTLSSDKTVKIEDSKGLLQARVSYVPDISKVNNELGLQVWTQINEAIKKHSQFS